MTCKNLLITLFLSTIAFQFIQSQNVRNDKIVSSVYDRFAFTYLINDYRSDKYDLKKKEAFKSIKVPAKYFDNSLSSPTLSVSGSDQSFPDKTDVNVEIKNLIDQNNIANAIVALWFNRQPNGSFNMNTISERGKYNANINDIQEALLSERGLAIISDAGEKLINRSYILVFDVANIKTMEEIAKAKKKKPSDTEDTYWGNSSNEAKQDGYKANVSAYLYKLHFNDSIAALFYNNLWISQNSENNERKQAFDEFHFPVTFVKRLTTETKSAQIKPGYKGAPSSPKSKEQLFKELVVEGVESIKDQIEKMETFEVKATVDGVKPIRSRIGLKEGVYVDQRYFVYQNRGDRKTGETVKTKRMAVIRAKNIADNRKIASSEIPATEFYQVGGRKVEMYSMFIGQKNDVGIGFSAGASSGAINGPVIRLEANIGQLTKASAFPTGLKLYGDAAVDAGEYETGYITDLEDNDFSFTYLSVGLGKEIYFARHFQMMPYVGYAYESASFDLNNEDDSKSIYTHALGLGITFGMNLLHNLQVKYSANIHAPLAIEDTDGYLNVEPEDVGWTDLFEGRSGFSQFIQLRILF